MDKKFWKSIHFYEKYKPKLHCPTCDTGLLTITKDNIKYIETHESLLDKNSPNFEYEWIKYRFTAIMVCNNPSCKDIVAVSGSGGVEQEYIDDEGNTELIVVLTPKYFEPALKIIPIKEEYHKDINRLLLESFALFFCDNSACANKIRQVVEKALDLKKIKTTTINKNNKRVPIALHHRIGHFKTKYPTYKEIADNFLAIKWIGNVGSHTTQIKRDHLLDAYTILQHSLDELFLKKGAEVKKLTKKIIKKKGKLK